MKLRGITAGVCGCPEEYLMLQWELSIKTPGLDTFSTIAPFIWKQQEMQEFKSVGCCTFGLLVTL